MGKIQDMLDAGLEDFLVEQMEGGELTCVGSVPSDYHDGEPVSAHELGNRLRCLFLEKLSEHFPHDMVSDRSEGNVLDFVVIRESAGTSIEFPFGLFLGPNGDHKWGPYWKRWPDEVMTAIADKFREHAS